MAHPPNLRSERGFALLEGILGFATFFLGTSLCLSVLYVIFAQTWLMHLGHLALLCQARREVHCAIEFKRQATKVIKFGRVGSVQFYGDVTSLHGVKASWTLGKRAFRIHQTLDWDHALRKRDL